MPTLDELIAHHAPARDVSAATVRDAASAAPVLVVLDDDPTGTQSIHDLPVLTRWDEDDLEWALSQRVPALYVLTNTRSLDPDAAEQRNREVARAAQSVAKRLGVEISFVSRSDSTLRGHFPLETDTLVEEVEAFGGPDIDGVIIAPAFPDAGRVTVDGVHYFLDPHLGGRAVPAAETEFARDATFGYASSGLAAWVEEKTAGRNCAVDVIHLDLHTIRGKGAAGVAALESWEEWVPGNVATFKRRRDVAVRGLSEAGFDAALPKATMYVWVSVPGGESSQAFSTRALEQEGVIVMPGGALGAGGEGFFRIALTVTEERLLEATQRLGRLQRDSTC